MLPPLNPHQLIGYTNRVVVGLLLSEPINITLQVFTKSLVLYLMGIKTG